MTAHTPIIITGASGDIGAAATEALVRRGEAVIMACRNCSKASAVRDKIIQHVPSAQIEIEELHLDSFASVREFAARMQGRSIKAIFNNAGVISRDYRLCEDGFEESLTVNYLSPYLLTRLLLPALGSEGRVVNMISLTCDLARLDRNFFSEREKSFSQLGSYASSKLALMLFSIELSRRCGISVNMADPGIVSSSMISMGRWFDPLADIFFRPLCKRPGRGAIPAVEAILSDKHSRIFKGHRDIGIPKKQLDRQELSDWLWTETEKLVHFL